MPTKSRQKQLPNLEQILTTLREHLPQLREQYQVRNLWVFGSFVRGEAKKRSDVDLLVVFDEAPSMFKFVRLERHLSELLGVKVDLVMRTALKPRIGERILKEIVSI